MPEAKKNKTVYYYTAHINCYFNSRTSSAAEKTGRKKVYLYIFKRINTFSSNVTAVAHFAHFASKCFFFFSVLNYIYIPIKKNPHPRRIKVPH